MDRDGPVADVSRALHGLAGLDDRELVLSRELKTRSIEAWASVYAMYHERLYRYALVRLGSREEAEDVSANVFLRALNRIDSYRYDGKPVVAWLFGICQNLLREHRRAQRRQFEYTILRTDRDIGEVPLGVEIDLPETLDLQSAFGKLTPPQQEVVSLLHYAGFSVREASGMLGKSQRSIYYLEARALTSLKQNMKLSSEAKGAGR